MSWPKQPPNDWPPSKQEVKRRWLTWRGILNEYKKPYWLFGFGAASATYFSLRYVADIHSNRVLGWSAWGAYVVFAFGTTTIQSILRRRRRPREASHTDG